LNEKKTFSHHEIQNNFFIHQKEKSKDIIQTSFGPNKSKYIKRYWTEKCLYETKI